MKKSLIIGIIIGIVIVVLALAASIGSTNIPQSIPDTPQNITITLEEGLTMSAP